MTTRRKSRHFVEGTSPTREAGTSDQNIETSSAATTEMNVDQNSPIIRCLSYTPADSCVSKLDVDVYHRICKQFSLSEDEVKFPERDDLSDRPPVGYVTVCKGMLQSGAIPPFNPYLEMILKNLAIAPYQLAPNGYFIVTCLYVLFIRVLKREPTFKDICSLYSFKIRKKERPSFIFMESRKSKVITGLFESIKGFPDQFFYVRCPDNFFGRWAEGGKCS